MYKGVTEGYRWLAGVSGGIKIATEVGYKQCTKCSKKKVVEND